MGAPLSLVPPDTVSRLLRVDEIDREMKRLVNEAEAIEAKEAHAAPDLDRLVTIQERATVLRDEMVALHRVILCDREPPKPRTLLDRILRR